MEKNECNTSNFDQPDILDKGIYVLQTIEINKERFDVFFDNGCGNLCCKKEAVDRLEKIGRAQQIRSGPIRLYGVANQSSVSDFGLYKISLPLYDSKNAVMSGICVNQVTAVFPKYYLQSKVQSDIEQAYQSKPDPKREIPGLPSKVVEETDLMIGAQYFVYAPTFVFELQFGLTIYESVFCNPDGTRGVGGGPHPHFNKIEKEWAESNENFREFFNQQLELYKRGYSVSIDLPLRCEKRKRSTQNS